MSSIKDHSGSKYIRTIYDCITGECIKVDVYAVIEAFDVKCPATQHALKKLLCAGIRGKADKTTDLAEAIDSISRAIEMEFNRTKKPTVFEEAAINLVGNPIASAYYPVNPFQTPKSWPGFKYPEGYTFIYQGHQITVLEARHPEEIDAINKCYVVKGWGEPFVMEESVIDHWLETPAPLEIPTYSSGAFFPQEGDEIWYYPYPNDDPNHRVVAIVTYAEKHRQIVNLQLKLSGKLINNVKVTYVEPMDASNINQTEEKETQTEETRATSI